MDQVAEKTLQGAAKLHSLRRCQPNRLLVDPRVCIIDDEAGAAIPLGDNAQRGDTEMWESEGGREREDNPEALGAKVLDFLAHKMKVVLRGLVWTTRNAA